MPFLQDEGISLMPNPQPGGPGVSVRMSFSKPQNPLFEGAGYSPFTAVEIGYSETTFPGVTTWTWDMQQARVAEPITLALIGCTW